MELRDDIDLHVRVNAICGFFVDADTNSSIENKLISCQHDSPALDRRLTHPVKLIKCISEVFGHFVDLLQILKIAFHPMDFSGITILLQVVLCFLCMFLLVRQKKDLGRIVL